jgi:hypothetical protein
MIRAIITGATGMVGEGVLHECLLSDKVEQVLVINRRPCGITHPKLKEIIHADFYDISAIQSQLVNYNACYYCLGITSLRMKEEDYYKITYTLTLYIAGILAKQNPGMTFCYVSGAGTDGTELKRNMWMRVKGKTENDLMRLSFKRAYMFRPGLMKPTKGLKNTLTLYKVLSFMMPVFSLLFPKFVCTLKEVGIAMINVTEKEYPKSVLEVTDIVAAAKG